jgi:hypothetical protein
MEKIPFPKRAPDLPGDKFELGEFGDTEKSVCVAKTRPCPLKTPGSRFESQNSPYLRCCKVSPVSWR